MSKTTWILILPLLLSSCSATLPISDSQPEITVSDSQPNTDPQAPLPQETDIIRNFFNLINEGHPQYAIAMMTPSLIGPESGYQTWEAQFKSFSHVEVTSIKPYLMDNWSETSHVYQVTLNAILTSGEAEPIPYWGWGENPNIRWITIEKNSADLWQIAAIATGP